MFLHHQFALPFDAAAVAAAFEWILHSCPIDVEFSRAGGSEKQAESFPLYGKNEWGVSIWTEQQGLSCGEREASQRALQLWLNGKCRRGDLNPHELTLTAP
jgi:hypothetical protein